MVQQVNEKLPTFLEGMEAASKAEDPEQYLKEWIAKDKRLVNVFGYAMNPKFSMGMPDGAPPYKKSDVPLGLAEVELLHLWNKLYILYNPDLPQYKKEEHFITWLEKMNADEAELLIAIKDKRLHKVYKKVSEFKIVGALGWDPEQYRQMKQSVGN
jgi:hypothetical protein